MNVALVGTELAYQPPDTLAVDSNQRVDSPPLCLVTEANFYQALFGYPGPSLVPDEAAEPLAIVPVDQMMLESRSNAWVLPTADNHILGEPAAYTVVEPDSNLLVSARQIESQPATTINIKSRQELPTPPVSPTTLAPVYTLPQESPIAESTNPLVEAMMAPQRPQSIDQNTSANDRNKDWELPPLSLEHLLDFMSMGAGIFDLAKALWDFLFSPKQDDHPLATGVETSTGLSTSLKDWLNQEITRMAQEQPVFEHTVTKTKQPTVPEPVIKQTSPTVDRTKTIQTVKSEQVNIKAADALVVPQAKESPLQEPDDLCLPESTSLTIRSEPSVVPTPSQNRWRVIYEYLTARQLLETYNPCLLAEPQSPQGEITTDVELNEAVGPNIIDAPSYTVSAPKIEPLTPDRI